MKILHVTSLGYEAGGTETGIVLLTSAFLRMGHEVRVLSSNVRPEVPHFSDYEFEAFSNQPFLLKLVYRLFYPQSFFALRAALKDFNPDVVVLHTMSEVSPSVLFLLKHRTAVMVVHGGEDFTRDLCLWTLPPHFFKDGSFTKSSLTLVGRMHYAFHRLLTGPLYKIGFKNIDAFVSYSLFMQEELKKDGIKSIHIPNFTKLFDFTPLDPASKTLLYAGRLEEIKGVQYVIDALPHILSVHPRAELVVAGEGNYAPALKERARALGLQDKVRFVGHKSREELAALYAQAAIVYVPSVWPEIFGKTGIEAMSVGRPVIGSNTGGIAEWLVDGETGFLVSPADEQAIAQKTNELLSQPELLQSMSHKARVQAQRFMVEAHAARALTLYEDLRAR